MATYASNSGGDRGRDSGHRGHGSGRGRGCGRIPKKPKPEAKARRRGPGIAELERILREQEIEKMNNQADQPSPMLHNSPYPSNPQPLPSPPSVQMTENSAHLTPSLPQVLPDNTLFPAGEFPYFQVPPSPRVDLGMQSPPFQGHAQNINSSWPVQEQPSSLENIPNPYQPFSNQVSSPHQSSLSYNFGVHIDPSKTTPNPRDAKHDGEFLSLSLSAIPPTSRQTIRQDHSRSEALSSRGIVAELDKRRGPYEAALQPKELMREDKNGSGGEPVDDSVDLSLKL